jgi:hypothetical protein
MLGKTLKDRYKFKQIYKSYHSKELKNLSLNIVWFLSGNHRRFRLFFWRIPNYQEPIPQAFLLRLKDSYTSKGRKLRFFAGYEHQ